ncbi:D-tyrosyl-tRNA(Tyr) deacylase [Alteracholeplasma palmae J233]|uniref:D-aminoacyl-tRNA deacylase n=1 Tax=Alteracholeplasma palmae (strain ATCC 49389 / J233) TaxID=1318466 RepID=U4KRY2_ALTPJ|nr:D-aminoacyl-tRNA deacylase [Alteracholeplasma palmae]CCV64546.1 D-tyrosyl-tRNA(Tyr) deacylase [Alteracholeplasma palmae J233]
MKVVVQRVTEANVTVSNKVIGSINEGLLVYVGFTLEDTEEHVNKMIQKIIKLRIFEDSEQKMNLNILDVKGSCLLISQFTLYADASKNNRPSFTKALNREKASLLYQTFVKKMKEFIPTEEGEFGADMKIASINNGPVTIIIEI